MATYVICAACGARIRADRNWCLRCDAPLVAAPEPAPKATRRDWMTVGGVAAGVGVLILFGLLFRSPAAPERGPADVPGAPQSAAAKAPSATSMAFSPVTAADHLRVGTAAFDTGAFEAARASYEQAIQKNPNDAEAINDLGQTLAHLKRTDEAIDQFARAIQIAPDRWSYHFNLAHAQEEKGQWDLAIAEYRRASELFSGDYATQYNLGMALHKKGEDAEAVKAYARAIDLAPGESVFHVSLGQSYEKLGRLDDARKEYSQYLDMDPDGADAPRVKTHLQGLAAQPSQPQGQP